MSENLILPPTDAEYLTQVDIERQEVIGNCIAEYRNPEFGPDYGLDRIIVTEKPDRMQRLRHAGARITRAAGISLFAVHTLVGSAAYSEIRGTDDDIAEAISDSGLEELDTELVGKNIIEIAAFLAHPEQQEEVILITRALNRDFGIIERDTRDSAQQLQSSALNGAAYGLVGLVSHAFLRRKRQTERKDGFQLIPESGNLRGESSRKIPAPAPYGHVTKATETDDSAVMQLDVKALELEPEFDDRLILWYQRNLTKVLIGGIVVLNPVTFGAANVVDDLLDLTVPSALQSSSESLGGQVVDYEQDRISQSVIMSLEEQLPNTTAAFGGNLDLVEMLVGDTLQASPDTAVSAASTAPTEYRPFSSIQDSVGVALGNLLGDPYKNPDSRFGYAIALAATLSTLGIARSTSGRPFLSRHDNKLDISINALEAAIEPSLDKRDEVPEFSRIKRKIAERRRMRAASKDVKQRTRAMAEELQRAADSYLDL